MNGCPGPWTCLLFSPYYCLLTRITFSVLRVKKDVSHLAPYRAHHANKYNSFVAESLSTSLACVSVLSIYGCAYHVMESLSALHVIRKWHVEQRHAQDDALGLALGSSGRFSHRCLDRWCWLLTHGNGEKTWGAGVGYGGELHIVFPLIARSATLLEFEWDKDKRDPWHFLVSGWGIGHWAVIDMVPWQVVHRILTFLIK